MNGVSVYIRYYTFEDSERVDRVLKLNMDQRQLRDLHAVLDEEIKTLDRVGA